MLLGNTAPQERLLPTASSPLAFLCVLPHLLVEYLHTSHALLPDCPWEEMTHAALCSLGSVRNKLLLDFMFSCAVPTMLF